MTDFRVGLGQDSHRFEKEFSKPLMIAAVHFDGKSGLQGNSDGDVVLHALCNALCSAIGEGSISTYSDEICLGRGIKDSREYLKVALSKVKAAGFKLVNASIAIECKTPKIEPRREEMKKVLADLLGIPANNVGITATTGEELTPFGKGEGVQVFCIVSLVKKD